MSADNGIYIGKFDDGYRVIHAQAIEHCEGSPDDDVTLAYINNYFGEAKLLKTSDEAWNEAREKLNVDVPRFSSKVTTVMV